MELNGRAVSRAGSEEKERERIACHEREEQLLVTVSLTNCWILIEGTQQILILILMLPSF